MKKYLLPALLFVTINAPLLAQEQLNEETKNFAIKFAPLALRMGKISLGTEYNFGERNSVTFYAGIPFDKKTSISYDGHKSDVNTRAYSVMAGFRHYVGKQYMKGFYLEPYAKYQKHEGKGLVNGDLNNNKIILDTRTSYEGVGVGLQLGVQMIISRSITLDLFFLGPEVNNSKISTLSTDITNNMAWEAPYAAEAENDIREVLNDVPLIGNKVNVKVDQNTKTIATDYKGLVPGIRIGGSLGLRF
jgi:hypothetical protein